MLRLDTPGGQVDLTLDIVKMMQASPVPIIVYVWPTGAMAGSAGTFITLAGHAAAMTPGSTIGAASPVADGGQEIGETLRAKITNILAAEIENLAKRRGETAVAWARKAVIEAEAATAEQALELGVIDAVAVNVDDLLRQLDGLEVEVNGQEQQLQLPGAPVVDMPMTGPENTLNTLVNAIAVPGIAILLIVLGVQAIIGEFSQPGGYVLGTVGVVATLLGMFALGILNANWVGLGFILLSFLLFFLDIKAPTHGALDGGRYCHVCAGRGGALQRNGSGDSMAHHYRPGSLFDPVLWLCRCQGHPVSTKPAGLGCREPDRHNRRGSPRAQPRRLDPGPRRAVEGRAEG